MYKVFKIFFDTEGGGGTGKTSDLDILMSDDGATGGDEGDTNDNSSDPLDGLDEADKDESGSLLDEPDDEEEQEESDEDSEEDSEESEDEDDKKDKKGKKDEEEEDDKETDEDLKNSVEYNDLKKAGIFKKFPGLKTIFFREMKYTAIYPTIQDAEVASVRSNTLGRLEGDIAKGNIEPILKSISQNKETLAQIAWNVLPEIQKLDKDLHFEILKPIFKNLARGLYADGKRNNNKNAQNAAILFHQFVFENQNLNEDIKAPTFKKDEEDPVARKEKEFNQRQFTTAQNDVSERVGRKISTSLKESFKALEGVNSFMSEAMTTQISNELFRTLAADKRNQSHMNELWNKARTNGYSEAEKASIINTFLARAKPLLRTIRERVVKEALGKSVNFKRPLTKQPTRITGGGERTGNNRTTSTNNIDPKSIDWRKTSDKDILDGKVVARKAK